MASTSKVSYDREQKLIKRYGITQADYEQVHYLQGGGCHLCGRGVDEVGQLVVDHCHSTGTLRGLLCRDCNMALGYVHDNETTLRKMIGYLRVYAMYGELNND